MFWSDATQLTLFGTAKLWPTYMYFSNESKYRRCKPSLHLSNHVAYFEMVRLLTLLDLLHTQRFVTSSSIHSKPLQMGKA
jgi:hypothetical protein